MSSRKTLSQAPPNLIVVSFVPMLALHLPSFLTACRAAQVIHNQGSFVASRDPITFRICDSRQCRRGPCARPIIAVCLGGFQQWTSGMTPIEQLLVIGDTVYK